MDVSANTQIFDERDSLGRDFRDFKSRRPSKIEELCTSGAPRSAAAKGSAKVRISPHILRDPIKGVPREGPSESQKLVY